MTYPKYYEGYIKEYADITKLKQGQTADNQNLNFGVFIFCSYNYYNYIFNS